jgi:adenylate cyclase
MTGLGNHRKDLAVLETAPPRVPSIQHNPPTAVAPSPIAPWMLPNGSGFGAGSMTFPTSFYDDTSDRFSQYSGVSPGFRPGTVGRTGNYAPDSPDYGYFHDVEDRRPSIASIATASSSGSKGSVVRPAGAPPVHKSLKSFFGDDFSGKDSSETSLPGNANGKEQRSGSWSRHRTHSQSTETAHVRDSSPVPSRPRTPVPSSDVVPFLYQDSEVRSITSTA